MKRFEDRSELDPPGTIYKMSEKLQCKAFEYKCLFCKKQAEFIINKDNGLFECKECHGFTSSKMIH